MMALYMFFLNRNHMCGFSTLRMLGSTAVALAACRPSRTDLCATGLALFRNVSDFSTISSRAGVLPFSLFLVFSLSFLRA